MKTIKNKNYLPFLKHNIKNCKSKYVITDLLPAKIHIYNNLDISFDQIKSILKKTIEEYKKFYIFNPQNARPLAIFILNKKHKYYGGVFYKEYSCIVIYSSCVNISETISHEFIHYLEFLENPELFKSIILPEDGIENYLKSEIEKRAFVLSALVSGHINKLIEQYFPHICNYLKIYDMLQYYYIIEDFDLDNRHYKIEKWIPDTDIIEIKETIYIGGLIYFDKYRVKIEDFKDIIKKKLEKRLKEALNQI